MVYHFCIFFFFQAEDGIRDLTVTGVQTCALPIFESTGPMARNRRCSNPVRASSQDVETPTSMATATKTPMSAINSGADISRSEERRVGKECRARVAASQEKRKIR